MIVSVRSGALLPSPGLPSIKKLIFSGNVSWSGWLFRVVSRIVLMAPRFLTVKVCVFSSDGVGG